MNRSVFDLLTANQTEKIVAYHSDKPLEQRIQWLAERANERSLSEEEQFENRGYARANRFLSILCARVRRRLAS